MAYYTRFMGEFKIDRPLDEETAKLLRGLCNTRRMKRSINGYGIEGEFYIDGTKDGCEKTKDPDIIDYNRPPSTQPSLYCDWIILDDNQTIQASGEDGQFYGPTEWIIYLIDSVLAPRGYVVNGQVGWRGNDYGDIGVIVVTNNVVVKYCGHMIYATKNPKDGLPISSRLVEKLERAVSIRENLIDEDWRELESIAKELREAMGTAYQGSPMLPAEKPPRMLIYMNGGLINDIRSTNDIDVLIIDTDADDVDQKKHEILNGQDAYVVNYGTMVEPEFVNTIFEEYLENHMDDACHKTEGGLA
jgi:hypothetical protein